MTTEYFDECPAYEEGQPEVDYVGSAGVNTPRKPSGRCGKTANTAKCRRWRQSHRSRRRDYMRRYMAARRQRPVSKILDT